MANIKSYDTKAGVRWRVRYRKPDGSQTDKRGFKRKKDAEDWAAEHVTIAKATGSYIDPQAGKATIGELYERWMLVRRPLVKQSTLETDERTWRTHVAPQWADRRINGIERPEVQLWVSGIAARRSASTTIKAYALLKSICDMAVRDRLVATAPTDGIILPKRRKRKERRVYLTIGQLLRFADEAGHATAIPRERRALVLVLGLCGIRWGEASGLHVRDVDFAHGRLHIDSNVTGRTGHKVETTPKNHEVRDVPMPRVVADALREVTLEKGSGERVFLDPSGQPLRFQSASEGKGNRTWWPSALRRAGLPMLSPHDLRHTAASIAVHCGANVKALQRMLGHASAAMTLDVYADLFDGDLDDVAALIDASVELAEKPKECGQNVGRTVSKAVSVG